MAGQARSTHRHRVVRRHAARRGAPHHSRRSDRRPADQSGARNHAKRAAKSDHRAVPRLADPRHSGRPTSRRGGRPHRGGDRGERVRARWDRDAAHAQSHDCVLRPVLRAQASGRRVARRAAVHPVLRCEHRKLGRRFKDVTVSTVIGTGVVAAIQGALLGLAFAVAGLPNGLFLGVGTMAFAILPVVGSGLIWGPAAVVLYMQGRPLAALLLAAWGVLVVGSVDNFIRPLIYRRFSAIHPLITLIGGIGGVSVFGLLGLLIGPLALSYFFELIRMYREEYLEPETDRKSTRLNSSHVSES